MNRIPSLGYLLVVTGSRWPVRAVLALALALVLAGCGGPSSVRKDLLQAVTDATATVRTAEVTFGLVGRGRTTRSHAVTVFVDMNRQLDSAAKTVTGVSLDDPGELPDRDQVLAAVQAAQLGVLTGRDCLRTSTPCATAAAQLRRADDLLGAAETTLRAEQ